MVRPSPTPRPGPLVEKKGVKSFCTTSGGMPGPLSFTETTSSPSSTRPRTRTRPVSSGTASMAFWTRLESTWPNSSGTHSSEPSPSRSRSTFTWRPVAGSTIPTTAWAAAQASCGTISRL